MSLAFASSRLTLIRGTTWADSLQLTDSDGDPISLVDIEDLVMRVRISRGASVLMELSVTNERITIVNAAEGQIAIAVSAEDTLDFPLAYNRRARYVYDAVIDRGGDPQVIEPAFSGRLTVNPQTTRLLAEP